MHVADWMSRRVVAVEEEASLALAASLLRKYKIRRLPVLRYGHLSGIITDRDLRSASPSQANTLDMWELHNFLSRLTVRDYMTSNPITIDPEAPIEEAALLLHDRKIGGLPVVDSRGKLVGILTEYDVFQALIEISGVRHGGARFHAEMKDLSSMSELIEKEGNCIHTMIAYTPESGSPAVLIRLHSEQGKDRIEEHVKKLH